MAVHHEANLRKLTTQEILSMLEAGILSPDEPVELLDGRLVTVSPQGSVHFSSTVKIQKLLWDIYDRVGFAAAHSTIDAGPHSLPEPDVAIVRGDSEDYEGHLPCGQDLILVVEVVHTTHRESRAKAPIYAGAGVPVLWLVDIPKRRVEVYSGGATAAGDYATMTIVDEVDQLDLPEVGGHVSVSELLPRASK